MLLPIIIVLIVLFMLTWMFIKGSTRVKVVTHSSIDDCFEEWD